MKAPRFVSLAASLLTAFAVLPAQATIIDHNAIPAVSGYSQATMDQIGTLNFYFAHASVGGNMIEGLDGLHAAAPTFYQLQSVSASSTPPSNVLDGRVYENSRGNPGWQDKLTLFDQALANGWQGKVNLAMDKFCYIDQNADAGAYLSFMQTLETRLAGSGTRLIYATMPLTIGSDSDNILRNDFNAAVRAFVAGHNDRLLFDIADIEAWDSSGVEHTFTSGTNTYQQLYTGFTSDGGHLNTLGSQHVALGFYAVANAALVPEPETYAVLLAGLGVVGVAARRRRPG